MRFIYVAVVFFAILIVIHLFYRRKSKQELAATHAFCDTTIRLVEWKLQNPHMRPGDSPDGTLILQQAIAAEIQFKKTHPYIKDSTRLDELYAQL